MDFRADILPHRDRLYRLALSITAHTAEAEDVVQETMLRAWQHRDEWPQIQNPAAWLAQVCKRLALDSRKRLDRLRPLDATTADSEQPRPLAALSAGKTTALPPTPADTLEQHESLSLLSQLIRQLPPPQDDLVRLRDIIRESFIAEVHPDFLKGPDGRRSPANGINPTVEIAVLYGCASTGGMPLRVKTTIKRLLDSREPQEAYTYEISNVEVLKGNAAPVARPSDKTQTFDVSILLHGVRGVNGELLLEAAATAPADANATPPLTR